MGTQSPRKAYCTGCGRTFPKMHLLMNHRGTFRCGGRFLPVEEQQAVLAVHYAKDQANHDVYDRELRQELNSARIDLMRMRHDRLQGG